MAAVLTYKDYNDLSALKTALNVKPTYIGECYGNGGTLNVGTYFRLLAFTHSGLGLAAFASYGSTSGFRVQTMFNIPNFGSESFSYNKDTGVLTNNGSTSATIYWFL